MQDIRVDSADKTILSTKQVAYRSMIKGFDLSDYPLIICNTSGRGGHSCEVALERSVHHHKARGEVRDVVIGANLAHDWADSFEQAGLERGEKMMLDVVVEVPVVKFDEIQKPVGWLPIA